MSDYSPTHWMKDAPENFHCEPDGQKTISSEKALVKEEVRKLCGYKDQPNPLEIIQYFQSEKWSVDKNLLRSCLDAIESGLEHTNSVLMEHDSCLGRTTRKNKSWAETLENDISLMKNCIERLKLIEVENSTHYP